MLVPLSPPPGINSDDTTFAAEGRWADGNHSRFYLGRVHNVGGSSTLNNGMGAVNIVKLFVFRQADEIKVAVASTTKLHIYNVTDNGLADITPATWGTPTGCSFAMWGEILLVNPTGGRLYEWNGTGLATHVTQAPVAITTILVTPQRQVLALGCNEEISATFNGLCVRGCDLENYTVWTTTASNNAFEHIIDGGGIIVTARMVGEYPAIWTSTSLNLGQFLGDPGQTYRFDKVAENESCCGLEAVVVVNRAAYWIDQTLRMRAWTPGANPQTVPCPISVDFSDNCSLAIASRAKLTLFHNAKFDEIWCLYPDTRDGGVNNSRYIAYCLNESAAAQRPVWFRGALARTTMASSPLLAVAQDAAFDRVLSGDTSGVLRREDIVNTSLASSYVQSADQYLDNSQRRVMIRSFIPDFEEQDGSVDLTLFVRDRPMSSATTKGPHTITTSTTKKDFRASGKLIAVKMAWSNPLKIGKPLFDTVPMGER